MFFCQLIDIGAQNEKNDGGGTQRNDESQRAAPDKLFKAYDAGPTPDGNGCESQKDSRNKTDPLEQRHYKSQTGNGYMRHTILRVELQEIQVQKILYQVCQRRGYQQRQPKRNADNSKVRFAPQPFPFECFGGKP